MELRIRLLDGDTLVFGPGRAELLDGIARTGSIAAAGRAMHMSYKRAWQLVDALNASFATPLVTAAKGGPGGGGARLTPLGAAMLAAYRSLEAAAAQAGAEALNTIAAALAK